jgi:hypothetical protein
VTFLSIEDFGLLRAKPELVKRVIEPNSYGGDCARLVYYRSIAKIVIGMFDALDGLRKPGNYPAARHFADDPLRLEHGIGDSIKESDIDLQGFMLRPEMQSLKIGDISQLYARMVLGHHNDENCSKIIKELETAKLRVKLPDTCP